MIYTIVSKYLFEKYYHDRIIFYFTRVATSGLDAHMADQYIKTLWTSCKFAMPIPKVFYGFEKTDPQSVAKSPIWLVE